LRITQSTRQCERLFYTYRVAEEFPEISCPRCERRNGQIYTVPLRLVPPGALAWQALCGDCFREVLEVEPSEDLTMKPVRHGRRGRR
jgi:hypothetical protein